MAALQENGPNFLALWRAIFDPERTFVLHAPLATMNKMLLDAMGVSHRSSDWHITGWRAVLLAPIFFPVALVLRLLPFMKKTRDRTPAEVAGYLKDFLDGTGAEWDWDDFTSVPITAPELEAIRIEADRTPLPLDVDGRGRLEKLLTRAYALRAAGIDRSTEHTV